jgi:hypothetical protein
MKIKKCSRCKIDKNLDQFHKSKGRKDGRRSHCKSCRYEYSKNNIDKLREAKRKYTERNLEKVRKSKSEYHLKNREKILIKQKFYYNKNKEQILAKDKEYRKRLDVKKRQSERRKERKLQDPGYKAVCNLRRRICSIIRRNSKAETSKKLLGCDKDFLVQYLASKFIEGMTWDNYGPKGWHIDHIIPCSSFDMSDPEQQKQCFHYTNLQPLWAEDNRKKSGKLL